LEVGVYVGANAADLIGTFTACTVCEPDLTAGGEAPDA
jgi:hypothetical protein